MGVPAVRDDGAAQEGPRPCHQGFIQLGFENLGGGRLQNTFGEPFHIKTTKSGHPPSIFSCPLIHMTPGIPSILFKTLPTCRITTILSKSAVTEGIQFGRSKHKV